MPLSDWLPEYDVHERHERHIAATPERALELALRAPAAPDRIVRALFRLRGIPRTGTIEDLAELLGLPERERTPVSWVVAGGKSVRIGLDFVAVGTRVQTTSTRSRRLFRAYWLVVGPFSALVRRRWLRAIARYA